MSTSVALRQRLQQCLGLLQVGRVQPLGEPPVDWCQQVMGFLALALLLPQFGKTCCCTEFPGFCRLLLGYRNSLLEAGFRLGRVRDGLLQRRSPPLSRYTSAS